MLTIRNLSFGYRKGTDVLRDYSLDIAPGTVCGLLGPNGAGKSTLLYLICGLLRPRTGEITYNGLIPAHRSTAFLSEVYIVPEEFYLPPVKLSEYISENAKFYPNFSLTDMEDYLRIFDLSSGIHLGQLSMGQKKKAFLSFALACNTPLLILDEPTNGLDISSKRAFRQALMRSMSDNKTIIISTHQVYDIEKILDHTIIVDNDGVKLNASMAEIGSKLRFLLTTDPERSARALLSIPVAGGWNIVEYVGDQTDAETEVNLELLYELVQKRPDIINQTLR